MSPKIENIKWRHLVFNFFISFVMYVPLWLGSLFLKRESPILRFKQETCEYWGTLLSLTRTGTIEIFYLRGKYVKQQREVALVDTFKFGKIHLHKTKLLEWVCLNRRLSMYYINWIQIHSQYVICLLYTNQENVYCCMYLISYWYCSWQVKGRHPRMLVLM